MAGDLNNNEKMLVDDAQSLIDEGNLLTLDLFLIASKGPQYGSDITEDRAKELYKLLKM